MNGARGLDQRERRAGRVEDERVRVRDRREGDCARRRQRQQRRREEDARLLLSCGAWQRRFNRDSAAGVELEKLGELIFGLRSGWKAEACRWGAFGAQIEYGRQRT